MRCWLCYLYNVHNQQWHAKIGGKDGLDIKGCRAMQTKNSSNHVRIVYEQWVSLLQPYHLVEIQWHQIHARKLWKQ